MLGRTLVIQLLLVVNEVLVHALDVRLQETSSRELPTSQPTLFGNTHDSSTRLTY